MRASPRIPALAAFTLAALAGVPVPCAAGDPADSLRTEERFAANGIGPAAHLGADVAGAGDLNGDGFADYCAGAPEGGESRGGETWIWFGRAGGPAEAPGLVLRGTRGSERFGSAVAGVGDLNRDGYDDLAVGSPSYSSSSTSIGRVQVYFGGPAMDAQADVVFTGTGPVSLMGANLSALGDYDGDGHRDFAASSVVQGFAGSVDIYFGAADPAQFRRMVLAVTSPGNGAGAALAPVGDWDGDGRDDLAVGSALGLGKVEVYGYPSRVLAVVSSTIAHDGFGQGVALLRRMPAAEDLLAVVVPYARPGGNRYGEVVLFGRNGVERGRLYGTPYMGLGPAIDGSDDLDGDGIPDLAFSAPGVSFPPGEVYVWSGRRIEHPDAIRLAVLRADHGTTAFGQALAFVPGGDGPRPEIFVGAPEDSEGGLRVGRVELHRVKRPRFAPQPPGRTFYPGEIDTIRWSGAEPVDIAFSSDDGASWTPIFQGAGGADDNTLAWSVPPQPTLRARLGVAWAGGGLISPGRDVSAPFRIAERIPVSRAARRQQVVARGETRGERAGSVLASLPDLDGDGAFEVVVGAPDANAAAGRVTLRLSRGGSRTWRGEAPSDRFGAALEAAHDLDGDGLADLVIGAPGHGSIAPRAGRVYVFGAGAEGDPALVIDGLAREEVGAALCAIADLSQTGVMSLVVGAPGAGDGTGLVRVYLGHPVFDAQADLEIAGLHPGGRFGEALAGGDLDGDGRRDLVVGAPRADRIVVGAGEVAVFRAPLATPAARWLALSGTAPFEAMGGAVAAGRDLDADGFADLAIGSPGYTGTVVDGGRVTVVFGGPHLDPAVALHVDGTAAGARLGTVVAMPGDMDADGVDDLAVGAPFRGPADAGAVQVHRGAPRVSPEPEFVVPGAPGDRLGSALAPAADPAAPGFHDLLASAPFANGDGPDAGRVDMIDMERYFLLRPNGGELWQAGTNQVVEWLGDEPAEVQLSLDGGRTYAPLADALLRTRVTVRAPAEATQQARVRVLAANPAMPGSDASDGDFEIRSAVLLVRFDLEVAADGVHLDWETDPAPGPEGIRGYGLVRRTAGGIEAPVDPKSPVITSTSWVDPEARPGIEYVLSALDATERWIELGRQRVAGIDGLRAGPQPWRGDGALRVAFEAPAGGAYTPADLEVALFDAAGREVAVLARGPLEARAGIVQFDWSGRMSSGARVAPGVYFLRASAPSAAFHLTRRIVVVR